MNQKLSILIFIFFPLSALGQKVQFHESGSFLTENYVCNQESISKIYATEIQDALDSLISCGVLSLRSEKNQDDHVLLDWPVAQNTNFTEPDYYGISNYVDHNSSFPNEVQDYNCGTVSYDLNNGYNHAGVDIFSSPFPWMKMSNNQVLAVAAASGVIVYKVGINYDKNCSFNNSEGWNAVYIAHEDGSTAWYGHLKNNSLTEKVVGETVTSGEYLGVVGSSGSSTGPHLHFELYNAADELIDPYVGPCNPTTSTSWWRDQKAYKDPRILKLMTHQSPPIPYSCYEGERYNPQINFSEGQLVYLATYLADQTVGDIFYHRLIAPDGSVYQEWNQEFQNNFASSYWYYTLSVTSDLPKGKWMYQVVYEEQEIISHNFYITNDSDKAVLSTEESILVESQDDFFTMEIANTGNIGLYIDKLNTSAGLNVDWYGDIAPGESKEIIVELNANNAQENQFVEIFHNAENSPKVINVTKEIVSLINSEIESYDFGEVMLHVYDTVKIPIRNSGFGVLDIENIVLSSDDFYTDKSKFQIASKKTDTLEVYFRPTEEIDFNATLIIYSNAVNKTELSIALSGKGIPNLLLSNNAKTFGNLRVYPNPSKSKLTVNYELINDPICSLSIIDQRGRVFYNEAFTSPLVKEQSIDVSHLPHGLYFIQITTENNDAFIKKFIKN